MVTRSGSGDKAAGLIRRRIRKILQTKRERERGGRLKLLCFTVSGFVASSHGLSLLAGPENRRDQKGF